jgi:hypothetical protein
MLLVFPDTLAALEPLAKPFHSVTEDEFEEWQGPNCISCPAGTIEYEQSGLHGVIPDYVHECLRLYRQRFYSPVSFI